MTVALFSGHYVSVARTSSATNRDSAHLKT